MVSVSMDLNFLPQVNIPEGVIHLGIGQPGSELLPSKELRQACAHAQDREDCFYLSYGEERGNANFRNILANFLSEKQGYRVHPDQLFITNGNSQALDFICTRFARPGDTVFVEEPSYFLALKIFSDHQLKPVSIPVGPDGLDTRILKKKLEKYHPVFLYTIPAFHNPSSVTLSLKKREELVHICAEKKLLIIADEVYHLLHYGGDPPFSMGYWKDQCPVISLGSFSKILAPGLRLGWMETSEERVNWMAGTGLLESGGGLNPFTSEMVHSVIQLGLLDDHVKRLKKVYARRIEVFCRQLSRSLPVQAKFQVPQGGYFIWVTLPEAVDTGDIRTAARKEGIDFNPGAFFSHQGRLKNCMRLSFSLYDEPHLITGAERLGRVLEKFL